MAITNDVNTSLLNDCFELQPFHGLCKPDEQDMLRPTYVEQEENVAGNDDDDIVVNNNSQAASKSQMASKEASFEDGALPEMKVKLSNANLES